MNQPGQNPREETNKQGRYRGILGVGILLLTFALLAKLAWMGNQWGAMLLSQFARPAYDTSFTVLVGATIRWGRFVSDNIFICMPVMFGVVLLFLTCISPRPRARKWFNCIGFAVLGALVGLMLYLNSQNPLRYRHKRLPRRAEATQHAEPRVQESHVCLHTTR